jgi:hypothetical protein
MDDRPSAMFASIDDRIAKPGDPDLDFHLTGLRIDELVVLHAAPMTEITLTFDTSEAAGFWIDSRTRERVFPNTVSTVEITGGFGMLPGSRWLLSLMIRRVEAWRADQALVAVTMAPGKWTLLHCPQHPAGTMVPMPRTDALNTE